MNHPTRESVSHHIIATITQRLGRRYLALEHLLSSMPIEALNDLNRLIKDFDSQIDTERREGRKDVMVRGKMHL